MLTTTGALGGGDLGAAAAIVAQGARDIASSWSASIPASIRVDASAAVAVISADSGPAYPAEEQRRHPLFGDRSHWYAPPGPPFLGPAADAKAGAAMARYARKIDRMLRARGWS